MKQNRRVGVPLGFSRDLEYATRHNGGDVARMQMTGPQGSPPDQAADPIRLFPAAARFQPVAFLGRGSMGLVFRAYDRETDTEVALKTLSTRQPDQLYQLKQEFRVLSGIRHANLVELYELLVTETDSFFTMELIEGADFLAAGRCAVSESAGDAVAIARVPNIIALTRQLVRGVAAVHAAGKLHRDIKPSNILVTRDDRVVLLDFGLATALGWDTAGGADPAGMVGTFAYMAPEQAWGKPPHPAADWYSVGVVLYETLTGRLPFAGSPARALQAKMHQAPPPLRTVVAGIPERLDTLVASLLAPDPRRRPGRDEILATLENLACRHGHTESRLISGVEPRPAAGPAEIPFVGRAEELATLHAIFERVRQGQAAVVHVSGPSGIGKTELVHRFVSEIGGEGLVLRGRCHPQESVPYNALDAMIDALSRLLLGVPPAEVAALAPRYPEALTRVFPVLGRVPALGAGDEVAGDTEPLEIRRRGYAALRELLANLARRQPLVLWIDDVQWSDVDSGFVLRDLLRPPGAPSLLLLLSYRSEDRSHIRLLAALDQTAGALLPELTREVMLGPLDATETRQFVSALCGTRLNTSERERCISAVAEESKGSPFFIVQLVQHLLASATHDPAALHLAAVFDERLRHLSAATRHVLELACVAGRPIERSLLLSAAGVGEQGRPLVSALVRERLVRTTTADERPAVEAYHDRIREALLVQLPPQVCAQRHFDLATVLEATGRAEPEVLAHHFQGAGILPKAAQYAVAAGDKAAEAFAFDHAAQMYHSAREWEPGEPAWARTLSMREAEALVNAARFAEAGELFMTAATTAPTEQSLALRSRASEQFLAAGHMDQGVEVLSALLHDLGLNYPRTPRVAMARFARNMLSFAVRGFGDRPLRGNAAQVLVRGDTCYSAARTLVDIDPIRGVYFSTEALRYVLQSRDPIRQGLCLLVVGGSIMSVAGRFMSRLGQRMIRRAEAVAKETGSPLLLGTLAVQHGQLAMLAGRWREALRQCDVGVEALRRCRDSAYESLIGQSMALRALQELGDMLEFERRSVDLLQRAATIGNRFVENGASQYLSYALLARGDLRTAHQLAVMGQEFWIPGQLHLHYLYSIQRQALCALYEGQPQPAFARLNEIWVALMHSHLMRVPLVRVDTFALRGRLALALAVAVPSECTGLLRSCEKSVRALHRERRPDGNINAWMIHAGVRALQGRPDKALALLDRAALQADAADMALYAAVARFRSGQLRGGEAGRHLAEEAEVSMLRLGVSDPVRWAEVIAPGFTNPQPEYG